MNSVLIWESAAELERAGTPFVFVTLIGTRGHAPQDPGAKMIVTLEGLRHGTVGGGKVEAKCIEESKRILTLPRGESPTRTVTWNLQKDVGMTCGGEVTYLFELREAFAWSIAVFGAGHVAQALARVLETLACRAIFIDTRPEWIQRIPRGSGKIKTLLVEDLTKPVSDLSGNEFCVVMTKGHATDLPVLESLFARKKLKPEHFPYIGGIGSDVKALKLRNELTTFGVDAENMKSFHCPIGLPLGTNDPAEIAISIAAELIQCRDRVASNL